MSVTCPNRNSTEWQALEKHPAIGLLEAMRDYMETGEIRTPDQVLSKINERNNSQPKPLAEDEFLLPETEIDFSDVEEVNKIYGEEFIEKFANGFAERLNVPYRLVDAEEAQDLLKNTRTLYRGQGGFFFGGTAYFVKGRINPFTVVHEFSHPVVTSIAVENPKLFDTLYNQIALTPEGQELIDRVQKVYGLDANSQEAKEEVIVFALEKAATMAALKQVPSAGFVAFVKNVLYHIKQLLRKVFGNSVKVSDLNVNTSVQELAEMLASENFQINAQVISKEDMAQFRNDVQTFVQDVKQLQNGSKLQHSINTFYETNIKMINFIEKNPKHFTTLKEMLTAHDKDPFLRDINKILLPYQSVTNVAQLKEKEKEIDFRQQQANSFITSLFTMETAVKRVNEKLSEIKKNNPSPSQDIIAEVTYFGYLLDYWKGMVNEIKKDMKAADVEDTSELAQYLNSLQGIVDGSQKKLVDMYHKFSGNFVVEYAKVMNEQIEKNYADRKAELTKKKAPQKLFDDLEAEYRKFKLDSEKAMQILSGQSKDFNDVSWANAYFEAFTNSADPVIGSFATFMSNMRSQYELKVQNKWNTFLRKIEPLLKKVGYNPSKVQELGTKLTYVETTPSRNKEGKIEGQQVYSYLNKFKGWEMALAEFTRDKEEAEGAGDFEKLKEIEKKEYEFKRKWFHMEYKDEVYETWDKYRNAVIELDGKEFEVGKEAFKRRDDITRELNLLTNAHRTELEVFSDADEIKELTDRLKQLYSLTNVDGSQKTGEELAIAQHLKAYAKETEKFYEWIPKEGAFERALDRFEDQLVASGLERGGQEFNDQVKAWVRKNTQIQYDDRWYQERNEIFEKIKELTAKTTGKVKADIDISGAWADIIDTVIGFRDNQGQPIASDMSGNRIDKIHKLQQQIIDAQEKLREYSGLTRAEYEELTELTNRENIGEVLTAQENQRIVDLMTKKDELYMDKETKAELLAQFAKLKEIQKKEPTEYYLQRINYWMDYMQTGITVDEGNVDDLYDSDKFNYHHYFEKFPEFEEWFKKNHVIKQVWDKQADDMVPKYERLYVWSVTKPLNNEYIKKTVLKRKDQFGLSVVIPGIPIRSKYSYRRMKKEYYTEKKLGETIDVNGKFMPKDLRNSPFRNEAYYKLKDEDPTAFQLLQAITEFHLGNQKGIGYKLGYQIPRFEKENLEYLQTTNMKETGVNWFSSISAGIRKAFVSSADNYEQELNWSKENTIKLARSDMFDNIIESIPLQGVSKMELDRTSLDLFWGLGKFLYSTERYKALQENHYMAKAIKAALESDDAKIVDMTRMSKAKKLKQGVENFLFKKGKSVRSQVFNAFYEREFLGQEVTGATKDMAFINKTVQKLMKIGGFSTLAFDIPSAVINMFGAQIQTGIEAAGGKYVTHSSFLRGKAWATTAAMEISGQVYKIGPKSVKAQLVDVFDAMPGRFEEKFHTNVSRNVLRDSAQLNFGMSPRKYMEMQSSLELFGAYMENIKIERLNKDGSKEILSYNHAWEVKDGQITLKDGIDKKYDIGGEEFLKVKNQYRGIFHNLQGVFDKFSQPYGNRYLLYRLAAFMRKWFTSMMINRLGTKRYNWDIGDLHEGFYRTSMKALWEIIRSGGKNAKYLSGDQKRAMRKTAAEAIRVALITNIMIPLILGFDDDDPDRFAKIRERQGGEGLFDENLKFGGWLSNQFLYTMLKTQDEASTFMRLESYMSIIQDSSVVFSPTSKVWYRALVNFWNDLTGDDSAYYKQDVGPYGWQKEGEAKWKNDFFKAFGLTGKNIDPELAIKKYERMKKMR
jgi:hypothetical protein